MGLILWASLKITPQGHDTCEHAGTTVLHARGQDDPNDHHRVVVVDLFLVMPKLSNIPISIPLTVKSVIFARLREINFQCTSMFTTVELVCG